jgi:hypothetical protein
MYVLFFSAVRGTTACHDERHNDCKRDTDDQHDSQRDSCNVTISTGPGCWVARKPAFRLAHRFIVAAEDERLGIFTSGARYTRHSI